MSEVLNAAIFMLFLGTAIHDQVVMNSVWRALSSFYEVKGTDDEIKVRNNFIKLTGKFKDAQRDYEIIQRFAGVGVMSWIFQLLHSGVWMSISCILYPVDFPQPLKTMLTVVCGYLLVRSLHNYYRVVPICRDLASMDKRFKENTEVNGP